MLLAIVLTGHVTHFHGSLADHRSGLPAFCQLSCSFLRKHSESSCQSILPGPQLAEGTHLPPAQGPKPRICIDSPGGKVGTYLHPLLAALLKGDSSTDNPKKLSMHSQFTHFALFFLFLMLSSAKRILTSVCIL